MGDPCAGVTCPAAPAKEQERLGVQPQPRHWAPSWGQGVSSRGRGQDQARGGCLGSDTALGEAGHGHVIKKIISCVLCLQ